MLVLRPEVGIVFDISVVIERDEVAFIVEFIKGLRIVLDMIDKEDAIEMVDFVQNSAGEKIGGFEANFGAIFELSFDAGFGGARNFAINGWHRKAAFVIFDNFAFGFDNFGIQESSEVGIVFVIHVFANNNDALIVAKLWCSHRGG